MNTKASIFIFCMIAVCISSCTVSPYPRKFYPNMSPGFSNSWAIPWGTFYKLASGYPGTHTGSITITHLNPGMQNVHQTKGYTALGIPSAPQGVDQAPAYDAKGSILWTLHQKGGGPGFPEKIDYNCTLVVDGIYGKVGPYIAFKCHAKISARATGTGTFETLAHAGIRKGSTSFSIETKEALAIANPLATPPMLSVHLYKNGKALPVMIMLTL